MPDPVTAAAAGPSDAAKGTKPDVTFSIDGRAATGRAGEMLISAAERAGTYIPRFCYHPRMKPVGMCRMCLVEVGGPRGPALQPSCFIAVSEGMEVTTTSDKVKKAQDGVLEFLLANHPLDCPVCDKGGECPLQDQTLAYGPGESRFIEEKRHFEKPIAISELVLLDRERCIQCARCTRFAEEVAGEAQIDFAGRGEHVEVATFPDEPFSSYFSANTVQICPVGALTATPYRFTARPWDLDQVESTCTTCALGCRVAVQSSANRLTRLLGIDSEPVNHGWLCDKGRFVFESVNGDELADTGESRAVAQGQFQGEVSTAGATGPLRLSEPLVRKDGELVAVSWGEALTAAAAGLAAAKEAGGPEAVTVIGGARLTNEGAYAWSKLARCVLGTDSVDAQLGDGLPASLVLGLPRASIDDVCSANLVVLVTGDVREELPVLFLRLREAVVDGSTALIELTARTTSLTSYAAVSLATRPGDGPDVARALTLAAPETGPRSSHPQGAAFAPENLARARQLIAARGGTNGEGIVVVVGRASLAEHEQVPAEAARVLAAAWPGATFLPALRRGNVHGALDMGLAPGILPGRVALDAGREWFAAAWGSVPSATGRDATASLASLAGEDGDGPAGAEGGGGPTTRARALVALGADLLDDFPDQGLAARALAAADFVVAVTGHDSRTVARADVVLPAAVAHERSGTTTNVEGRITRLGQKLVAPGSAWSDWMIAVELADALGADLGLGALDEVWEEIEHLAPAYRGISVSVLDSSGAHDGVLAPMPPGGPPAAEVSPIDPMSLPGIESVERQGAIRLVGVAEPPIGDERLEHHHVVAPDGVAPKMLTVAAGSEPVHVPTVDSYSLRLVSTRQLYDDGSALAGSPSLTPLVPAAVVRANPYDLDRLGVGTGDQVRVRSARSALVLRAASDPGVPRGTVAVDFNLSVPAVDTEGVATAAVTNAAATLIDATALVNDVRLENL